MFANAICSIMELPKNRKAGSLTEAEVKKISDIIANPLNYNIPLWMLNRRNDYETGEDQHLINADLKFTVDNDIKRLRKIK